jgi:hypothetical protein
MLIHRAHHCQPKPLWKWPDDKPKPKLPAVHLPHYRVRSEAISKYLALVYKMRDFDFCRATGCVPGIVPEYRVTGELPPSWDSPRKAERIRNGQRTSDVALILNVLCLDGFIPAGLYVIDTKPETPRIDIYRVLLKKHRDPSHAECTAFRDKHKNEPDFMEKAATLDNAVLEWLKNQEPK